MNERIQKFAEQCTTIYDSTTFPVDKDFDYEKFAQLIVGECMRMCEVAQVGYLTHGLEKEASGAYSVKQYIEEYLGVES